MMRLSALNKIVCECLAVYGRQLARQLDETLCERKNACAQVKMIAFTLEAVLAKIR